MVFSLADSWHFWCASHVVATSSHCVSLRRRIRGGQSARPGHVPPPGAPVSFTHGGAGGGSEGVGDEGGAGGDEGFGEGEALAKSTGSHCGGTATGWLASATLFATLGLVMCGVKAAQKAAATPMRTSARKPEASFFACRFERLGGSGEVHGLSAHPCSSR